MHLDSKENKEHQQILEKTLIVKLDRDVHKEFHLICLKKKVAMTYVIRSFIEEFNEKNKQLSKTTLIKDYL